MSSERMTADNIILPILYAIPPAMGAVAIELPLIGQLVDWSLFIDSHPRCGLLLKRSRKRTERSLKGHHSSSRRLQPVPLELRSLSGVHQPLRSLTSAIMSNTPAMPAIATIANMSWSLGEIGGSGIGVVVVVGAVVVVVVVEVVVIGMTMTITWSDAVLSPMSVTTMV